VRASRRCSISSRVCSSLAVSRASLASFADARPFQCRCAERCAVLRLELGDGGLQREPLRLEVGLECHQILLGLRHLALRVEILELLVRIGQLEDDRASGDGRTGAQGPRFDATGRDRGHEPHVFGDESSRRAHIPNELTATHGIDNHLTTRHGGRARLEPAERDGGRDQGDDSNRDEDIALGFFRGIALDIHADSPC
jgi:hypothetical protein